MVARVIHGNRERVHGRAYVSPTGRRRRSISERDEGHARRPSPEPDLWQTRLRGGRSRDRPGRSIPENARLLRGRSDGDRRRLPPLRRLHAGRVSGVEAVRGQARTAYVIGVWLESAPNYVGGPSLTPYPRFPSDYTAVVAAAAQQPHHSRVNR